MPSENMLVINITLEICALAVVVVLILSMPRKMTTKNRRLLMQAMWLHAYTLLGGLCAFCNIGIEGALASVCLRIGAFVYYLFSILTCLMVLVYLYATAMEEPLLELRFDRIALTMIGING